MKFYKFRKCSNKLININSDLTNSPSLQEISKKVWTDIKKEANLNSMCGFKELNIEDIDNTRHIIPKNKKFNRA